MSKLRKDKKRKEKHHDRPRSVNFHDDGGETSATFARQQADAFWRNAELEEREYEIEPEDYDDMIVQSGSNDTEDHMEIDEETYTQSEEEEEEIEEERVPRMPKQKKHKDPDRLYHLFCSMGFSGTCYPHQDTMAQLGISRDIDLLFQSCGLSRFMTLCNEAYKEETCYFLATLQMHFHDQDDRRMLKKEGMGYITFRVRTQEYRITFKRLDKIYGFSPGTNVAPDYDEDELNELWNIIAVTKEHSSSRSKSALIRNPCFRYLHKALANTFYARRVTGNVNDSEMSMIATTLKDVMVNKEDGTEILGNQADTGLTVQFIVQLLGYADWAARLHTMQSSSVLCIGGLITPLLRECNIDLSNSPAEAARYMDITYLLQNRFLARKGTRDRLIYLFTHPEVGPAMIELPCADLSTIRTGDNCDFIPPLHRLYTPTPVQISLQLPGPSEPSTFNPEDHYFEEYNLPHQGKGLREAHRRIGVLQTWCKWQDKTINALKKSVKQLKKGMKKLNQPTKDKDYSSGQASHQLQRSRSLALEEPQMHAPEAPRPSSYELQAHRRYSQPTPPEPPRPSSHELQTYTRKPRRADRASSSTPLDQYRAEWSHHHATTFHSDPPLEYQAEWNTAQPPYTLDSMNASADAFFTNP